MAATLLAGSSTGRADFVVNGSFESTTAGDSAGTPSQVTNSNLSGWSISTGTPFDFVVMGNNGGFYNGYPGGGPVTFNFNPGPSPDGGNYIAANGDDFVGTLSQTISGLTAGANYAVTFDEATTTTLSEGAFNGFWQVGFGSNTQNSTQMATTSGSGTTWIMDTLVFTASSASQVLSFVAADTPGAPPFILLDGVSVSQVPEPATLGLTAVGVLGLLAGRLKWRGRAARRLRPADPPA